MSEHTEDTPRPYKADLVTTGEAADILGVSKQTVLRLGLTGRLRPYHVTPGRNGQRLYLRDDVKAHQERVEQEARELVDEQDS